MRYMIKLGIVFEGPKLPETDEELLQELCDHFIGNIEGDMKYCYAKQVADKEESVNG